MRTTIFWHLKRSQKKGVGKWAPYLESKCQDHILNSGEARVNNSFFRGRSQRGLPPQHPREKKKYGRGMEIEIGI